MAACNGLHIRISPIRMTSGSCRKTVLQADLKLSVSSPTSRGSRLISCLVNNSIGLLDSDKCERIGSIDLVNEGGQSCFCLNP